MIKKLESERLILEPISLNHVTSTYLSWLNDAEIIKHLVTEKGHNLKSLSSYVKAHIKNKTLMYAIILKNTKTHIGNIKIDPIDKLNMSGELGILIGDKTCWGKGYGKESCNLLIKHCFNSLNLNIINLGVELENKKAIILYEKLGFKYCDSNNQKNLRMFLRNDK